MKKLKIVLLMVSFLAGCASHDIPVTKPVAGQPTQNTSSADRKPATHAYASYTCISSHGLKLAYDGPGSNYIVGGYSNFYPKGKKNSDGDPLAILASQSGEPNNDSVGTQVGDELKVQIMFSFQKTTPVGKEKVTQPKGKCEPDDVDFIHVDSKSQNLVRIDDLSPEAQSQTGLKKGAQISFNCNNTEDNPVHCSAAGQWEDHW